jgi:UDP-N-acetylmuramyl pentapeptide phosphotransferase/UDP-N-acetylglucosamine-1-phosphate transferase
MLDSFNSSWQAQAAAAALTCAFFVSMFLVLTKKHHGHLTMDSTIGVQKFHAEPTPRVGGIGIYLGLLLAWFVVHEKGVRDILGIVLVAGLIPLVCGLAEDVTKRVGVMPRLLATMAGGIAAWLLTGVCLNRVDIYGIDWLMTLTPIAVIFTAFAVGGVANAINIIDGFHGLASGTTMIALVALGAISAEADDPQLAMACFLVAASIAGFWLVNYPWGKLFMGDGGAYFSGFALAWFAVLLPVRNPEVSVWAGLLVCAYPVIEVIYSIGRRARQHQSPGAADTGHLHSLIKVKLIRPNSAGRGNNNSVRNAAVAPIMWGFSAAPAIAATAIFDRPVLLGFGLGACAAMYHAFHRYLVTKRISQDGSPVLVPVAHRVRQPPIHHQRRRGRDRRAKIISDGARAGLAVEVEQRVLRQHDGGPARAEASRKDKVLPLHRPGR